MINEEWIWNAIYFCMGIIVACWIARYDEKKRIEAEKDQDERIAKGWTWLNWCGRKILIPPAPPLHNRFGDRVCVYGDCKIDDQLLHGGHGGQWYKRDKYGFWRVDEKCERYEPS